MYPPGDQDGLDERGDERAGAPAVPPHYDGGGGGMTFPAVLAERSRVPDNCLGGQGLPDDAADPRYADHQWHAMPELDVILKIAGLNRYSR